MMRITLDTNQLIRALMRPPELATFIMAWDAKRFKVIASPELIEEYERALAYPEVAERIFPELLRAFRSHLMGDIEIVNVPKVIGICRDPDDDKVIATALFGMIDYLLTRDRDLQTKEIARLLRAAGITIVDIDELVRMLD
jgi:uncharacterized protein